MKNKTILFLLLLPLILTGQSCKLGTGDGILPDSGIFKSVDSGNKWRHTVSVPTISGKPKKIGTTSVNTIEVDPQDNNAIYIGTRKNGIYYTHDGGEKWVSMASYSSGWVNSIKVDPDNKCVIYASHKNTVIKTADCGRTWRTIFIENNEKSYINSIAVDSYNNNIIYAGTSDGIIHKSTDGGGRWNANFSKVPGNISKFLIDKNNSNIIYIATKTGGLFKTTDGGVYWKNLNEALKKFSGYNDYKALIFNPSKKDSLFLASKYGILKTDDGGDTWRSIPLLTAHGKADIKSIAVDPNDDNNIFYTTKNIIYRTFNDGKDWETRKMFSTKNATHMIFSPGSSSVLYMTFEYPEKKQNKLIGF